MYVSGSKARTPESIKPFDTGHRAIYLIFALLNSGLSLV